MANVTAAAEEGEHPLNVAKIVVLSTIIVLTVLGNSLVILAIVGRGQKMTRMYYFILHLSLADLLTAFFTLLSEVVWTFTLPYFYGGKTLCKVVKFAQMVGPYLSSYVLIMTAIDRYQAICHPLTNCSWTPRRSNTMILVAWLIALLLCVPQAIIFVGTDDHMCLAHFPAAWMRKAYVTWFAVSNFFVPLLILVYCYLRICLAIWDNFNSKTGRSSALRLATPNDPEEPRGKTRFRRRFNASSDSDSPEPPDSNNNRNNCMEMNRLQINNCGEPRRSSRLSLGNVSVRTEQRSSVTPRTHSIGGISRAKIKTVKLTIVVIMGYVLCSAPFMCAQLWDAYGTPSEALMSYLNWLFWLLTLNSVVNPWIYMLFNANLVESLKRLCCLSSRNSHPPISASGHQATMHSETARNVQTTFVSVCNNKRADALSRASTPRNERSHRTS